MNGIVSSSADNAASAHPGLTDPASLARLEAHVRALPPFEDAELAPNIVLALLADRRAMVDEIYELRCAITGGEDAPGYVSSLPLQTVLDVQRENLAAWGDDVDRRMQLETQHIPFSPDYSAPVEPRTSDGRSIYSLLASAWFYGKWKAETHAEEEMQALMEARGFWPILGEGALMTMIGRDLFEGEAVARAALNSGSAQRPDGSGGGSAQSQPCVAREPISRADPDLCALVEKLTDAQRADIEAHIRGLTEEKDTYPTPEHGWQCFHCGEPFKTYGGARLHFGGHPAALPVCSAEAVKNAIRGNVQLEWSGYAGMGAGYRFIEASLDRAARAILKASEVTARPDADTSERSVLARDEPTPSPLDGGEVQS